MHVRSRGKGSPGSAHASPSWHDPRSVQNSPPVPAGAWDPDGAPVAAVMGVRNRTRIPYEPPPASMHFASREAQPVVWSTRNSSNVWRCLANVHLQLGDPILFLLILVFYDNLRPHDRFCQPVAVPTFIRVDLRVGVSMDVPVVQNIWSAKTDSYPTWPLTEDEIG